MAYCRFSSLEGRCDLYVYAHVDGTWVTDVATGRWPEGAPGFGVAVFADPAWAGRPHEEIVSEYKRRAKLREDWEQKNPLVPIDHPDAGLELRDPGPGACADRLEGLAAAGLIFPPSVIDVLRAEQAHLENNPASGMLVNK